MLPISLRGARTHNLKAIDLDLLPGQLIALTGVSGAGKSALALDTLYAEGQRRFVESFSPYARQFLERQQRPPTDKLEPIAATVAVDRRAPVKSSRSTLATLADLEPYLAALFAAEAIPLCPQCQIPARDAPASQAVDRLVASHGGARALFCYPAALGEDAAGWRAARLAEGVRRVVLDTSGEKARELEDVSVEELAAAPSLQIVTDRLVIEEKNRPRLQEALEQCLLRGGRADVILQGRGDKEEGGVAQRVSFARGLSCPKCQRTFEPAHARLFSYNSPLGACATCKGFGRIIGVDWDRVIPDPRRTIGGGAIRPWSGATTANERQLLAGFCVRNKIPMNVPWEKLTAAQRELVLEGEGDWEDGKYPGVRAWFRWLEGRTYKMHVRVLLSRYREYALCPDCGGARLSKAALAYRVAGLNLAEWHQQSVREARARIASFTPRAPQGRLAAAAIASRLGYLDQVGLGYLTLDRQGRTLSGGEAQRAGLTTALGAALTGSLFVLDEPSVGLHALDVPALAGAIQDLSRAGNTVLLVEHEEGLVRACDRVVELGPGAGQAGGRVLYDGPPAGLLARADVPTGFAWLRLGQRPRVPRPLAPRSDIHLLGVTSNNLKNVDVAFPLHAVTAVTGVSGSGKSTLVEDVLYRALARHFGDMKVERPGPHRGMRVPAGAYQVVLVDQSPLGRTARGNTATYTKAWDHLRKLLADEPLAQQRGLTPGSFSFNVAGGRCEACAGEGYETVEMQFLADVSFLCPVCQGKRFRPEVLEVRLRGHSVADLLAMTVDQVLEALGTDGTLRKALDPVVRVGLGYLPLGQPLSTLSGGEAQRLKLARALSESAGGAVFIVDEPSAGLHGHDVERVLRALHTLVDEGGTVIVVEHDLSIIADADWVIDLGPGAGPEGGAIVATGTPAQVAKVAASRTGQALRERALRDARDGAPGVLEAADSAPTYGRTSLAGQGVHAIRVTHAREHNLKGVSCQVPHGGLTVVTGPSGSGKSSLAFDVIYAEGQRRFMETLTPYARQFLPTLPRPDVDQVTGVPPAIALEQRTTRSGANSTVATVTEVAHYLRLLYAKVGAVHCPACDTLVDATSPEVVYQRIRELPPRGRYRAGTVYAPAVRARKGTYLDLFTAAFRSGIRNARVDGVLTPVEPPPKLARAKEHTIELIVYEGPLSELPRAAFDRALAFGEGSVRVAQGPPVGEAGPDELLWSTRRACPACGTGVPELDPRWFSFNTKQGQCPSCEGSGVLGGLKALETALAAQTAGDGGDTKAAKAAKAGQAKAREATETVPCPDCQGTRLAPLPRRVRLLGRGYADFTGLSVSAARAAAAALRFDGAQAQIAEAPHAELLRRLAFIEEVGLGYLGLDRPALTLSGGELQRLRLSAQLGSGLTGALYVLDEPTIGLHPRDTQRLIGNLRALAQTGSTVLVVEHDEETIRAADHLLDMGPSGGRGGGRVVSAGPAALVLANPASPTAQALAGAGRVDEDMRARPRADKFLTLRGARAHNLRGVDLAIPVGRLTVVAGVSGSGKSTLVRRVLYPALRQALGLVSEPPLAFDALHGAAAVKRALSVDQSPIGRTPRSVPATFLGIWDDIRRLYAGLPEAKIRGYTAARFSFNTGGGRCPVCEGQGAIVSEMSFLPEVITACEACGGSRFEPATLEIRYRGLHIGEVLHLSAADAAQHFASHPKIARPLATLDDLGVGYLQIGQGSNTLSGGEAQRLKLAAELTAGTLHEPTVYVLDEPTTGLHLSDVRRLIRVLQRLVDRGDTLVVIEHHPDVISAADHVVELGPEAGEAGGQIVFTGPPAALRDAATATGKFLAQRDAPPQEQAGKASRRRGKSAA